MVIKSNNFGGPDTSHVSNVTACGFVRLRKKFFSICLGFLQQKHSLVSRRDEDSLVCIVCSDCTGFAIRVFGDSHFCPLKLYTRARL